MVRSPLTTGLCAAALLSAVAATPAVSAGNAAKAVRMYNDINVVMYPGSRRCGLNDTHLAKYKTQIEAALKEAGLPKRQEAVATFSAQVFAQPYGLLKANCYVRVSLKIEAILELSNPEVIKTRTTGGKKQAINLVRLLGAFPITAYNRETFYTTSADGTPNSVHGALANLLKAFRADRGK